MVWLNKHRHSERGIGLVEVLLAISVFVLAISSVSFLIVQAMVGVRYGAEQTTALHLAKEGLAAVKTIRDDDFDRLIDGTHGLALSAEQWTFSGSSDDTDMYTRVLTIGTIDEHTKTVTSTVTWDFNTVRLGSVSLTQVFTDWLQTGNDIGDLNVNQSSVTLSASSTEITQIYLSNTAGSTSTIESLTPHWDSGAGLYRISIGGTIVFDTATTSAVTSGSVVDIADTMIGSSAKEMVLYYTENMNSTEQVIGLTALDQSIRYLRLNL